LKPERKIMLKYHQAAKKSDKIEDEADIVADKISPLYSS
jgi:hypothetical protein